MQQDQSIIGAIKIKDALFIGDEVASKDLEFIVSNKVTHIINCSGKQVMNSFENFGVRYLTLCWVESDHQILFDQRDQTLNDIYQFIENAHSQGESCLVHSVRGQSRSCCVLAAFFMKKYKWKLYKTLEFLNSRRPDLEIRASFFHQLTQLEQKLIKSGQGAYSSSWDPQVENELKLETDEKLLRNTYQNSKQNPPAEYWLDKKQFQEGLNGKRIRKIQWADENKTGRLYQYIGQNRSVTPVKKQQKVKSILRDEENDQKDQASNINNINGNVIHLTVNNYLTPQQQTNLQQNQVNNFFQVGQDKQKQNTLNDQQQTKENVTYQMNNNHLPSRGPRKNYQQQQEEKEKQGKEVVIKSLQEEQIQGFNPISLQSHSGQRRQQDSLKKHIEEKKKTYQSPYSQSINNKIVYMANIFFIYKQPQNKSNQFQKDQSIKQAHQRQKSDFVDRPQSANNQGQINSVQQEQQKRPNTGGHNMRQFSPVIKGQNHPKNASLIITNYNNKKSGMRYPSPGQQQQNTNNFLNNSLLSSKPTWK